jgi:hypothetical protein
MKIITHPGLAHRDEALAVGLILSERKPTSVQLFRREPTQAELDDPDVWVVDVGEQHNPQLHNFDHHQLPADAPPTCATTQVAEYFGLATAFAECPWYKAVAILDSKGPAALAKHLDIPRIPRGTVSPFELTLLRQLQVFSGNTPVHAFLCRILRFVAEDLTESSKELSERLAEHRAKSQVLRVGGMPTLVLLAPAYRGAITLLRKEWMGEHDEVIGMSISYDDRGDGWCLFRFDDHPSVDFTRLREQDEMKFVHASGFVGKTEDRLPLNEVLDLAAKAVSPLESL